MLIIEKNIPIPPSTREGSPATLLTQMVKGDSVLVHNKRSGGWLAAAKRLNIKIVTRKEGDGFRVWHNGVLNTALTPEN